MFRKLILLVGVMVMTTSSPSQGDTAFINAKIYTGTEVSKYTSFIVKDGRFSRFGTTDDILKSKTPMKVVDLNQALVMPGFIEAHAHLLGIGQSKLNLNVRGKQIDEIIAMVKEQSGKQDKGTWITGRGWDQNLWPNKAFPETRALDDIKNPVYLRRVDGHAAWVNSAALKLASIDKKTPEPSGGQILRDAHGNLTGVLIDNAISLVSNHLDKPTRANLEQYLNLGIQEAHRMGITSFHDAGVGKETLDLYEDLAKQNKLTLRIYAMIDGEDSQLVDYYLARGPLLGNEFLTIRAIKYFADGALGSRGATLLEDYHDKPGHRGLPLIEKSSLAEKTKKAIDKGFQVATHAIGDQANRLVLDAYEEALNKTKKTDTRLRVEHAQIIDPSDHERFKKLSVIASMQPTHCTSDMSWVANRLGETRVKDRAYPWRSLLNHGVTLAFGSDAPVENSNPIHGLYSAVTRADFKGSPTNGFMPEQKLHLNEALNGFYSGAAFAEFNEKHKGKIAVGYLADFAVFHTDLLTPTKTAFLEAKPAMTVVHGNIVFQE